MPSPAPSAGSPGARKPLPQRRRATTTSALLGAALAAALLAGCGPEDEGGCAVAAACCELGALATGEPSRDGAAGCVGVDLDEAGWGDPAALAERRLAEQADGALALAPGTVTRAPAAWVASTSEGKVARYDPTTGAERLRVSTWGTFPNRVAVAADGSVWITNRESGDYVHLDPQGAVACASEQGRCNPRALALDAAGDVWVGCHDTGEVIHVSGHATEGAVVRDDPATPELEAESHPRCRELGRVTLPNTRPHGLIGDADGYLWAAAAGPGPIARIDTRDGSFVEFDLAVDPLVAAASGCLDLHAVALDLDQNPWLANWSCANVLKIDRHTGAVLGVFTGGPEGLLGPRTIGLDRRGHLWVGQNDSHFVDQLRPDGAWVQRVDLQSCGESTFPGVLGTGSDADGNLWTVLENVGKLVKYSPDGELLGCYPDGEVTRNLRRPHTWSDWTGSTLDLVTSRDGRWRGRAALDRPLPWRLVTVAAEIPSGARLCLRVRAGATAAALERASWTTPRCEDATPPGGVLRHELAGAGPVPEGPLLEVELQLGSRDPAVTPRVTSVSVAARP